MVLVIRASGGATMVHKLLMRYPLCATLEVIPADSRQKMGASPYPAPLLSLAPSAFPVDSAGADSPSGTISGQCRLRHQSPQVMQFGIYGKDIESIRPKRPVSSSLRSLRDASFGAATSAERFAAKAEPLRRLDRSLAERFPRSTILPRDPGNSRAHEDSHRERYEQENNGSGSNPLSNSPGFLKELAPGFCYFHSTLG